ncbi:MAG: NADH-quinone oxidoreductase subunit J [Gammaproteobacteria bacterium]|nr:NADH-quinone oxidoreductase subunit J [Gammaproteobacteria bacterium]
MHAELLDIIFYIFAGLTAVAAFFAVIQKNPVRAVLFLVLAFFGAAVLWMLAEAEFLALILVLVYVGAVMTLFLFVVMMLNIDTETMKGSLKRYLPWAILGTVLFVGLLIQAMPKQGVSLGEAASLVGTVTKESNTVALGMVLYTEDVLAFELAAMILLVAIIAAITLTHRVPRPGKRQNIVEQIMTRRDERVTLVSMDAEKPGEGKA